MANNENLKKWKPGQSGNPAGKKPGTPNSKTVLKKWLEKEMMGVNPTKRDDQDKPVKEQMPIYDQLALAQIAKALKGDTYAYNSIIDRIEGSPRQRIEHSGDEDKPLIPQNEPSIDLSKLPSDVLAHLVNAIRNKENSTTAGNGDSQAKK